MDYNTYAAAQRAKLQALTESDKKAKQNSSLIGRYIAEQVADGHAYYKVVDVIGGGGAEQAVLEHVAVYDGYRIPLIDAMDGRVPVKYVLENIECRDRVEEMFNINTTRTRMPESG